MWKFWTAITLALLSGAVIANAQTKGSGSGSGSQSTAPAQQHQSQPYAGQKSRLVPSLSDREIADLEAGRGMGFALPAELNGYPGPLHVLEHADALKLTDQQRTQVQTTYDWMKAQAEGLGLKYVAAETALAAAFREGKIDSVILAERIRAAEVLRSELRQVHLVAHIETAALLNVRQKEMYEVLRGYVGPQPTDSGKGSGSGSGSGSRSLLGPSRTLTASCNMGSAGETTNACCCGGGRGVTVNQCGASGGGTSCAPHR